MKNYIYTFVLAVLLTLCVILGYVFFKVKVQTDQNKADIVAIVNFINQQVQRAQMESQGVATTTKK